jgi:energy-coupling factor transporter ATP-binding protein EcfA2
MTDNRIESFRTAFRNLDQVPLVTPEKLDLFRVEYGTEIIAELEQLVDDCTADNNKIVFTGHRGSGKSTLLGQFCRQVQDRYFVVRFSISDLIEMSDVNHINILFAVAVKLMEDAEDRGIKISNKTRKAFYLWFSKHTKIESAAFESALDIEAGVDSNAIALLVKFFAKIKAALKANHVIREEIKTEFSSRISDLTDRIDDIAIAIQLSSGKEVLVVIDDLDKLSLDVVEQVYRNNINVLFQPQFRIIYTIPMAATGDVELRAIIRNATNNRIQQIWATKFFSRGLEKIPGTLPIDSSVKVFEQILYKRLSPDLIEPDIVQAMILKSGGALSEFIRLARLCCQLCSLELRKNPSQQDLKITDKILEKALVELRIEMAGVLGQNAYTILAEVYKTDTPLDIMDKTFLDLLHALYIIEYRNSDLWFGLNPIIKDLLELRKLI